MIERRGSENQKGSSGLGRIGGILIVSGSHSPSTSVIGCDHMLRRHTDLTIRNAHRKAKSVATEYA